MDINVCRVETSKHIAKVQKIIHKFIIGLLRRAENHDSAKLDDFEATLFAQHTDRLNEIEFGSEEYKQELAALQPALDHHYSLYSHHPQHYEAGINAMTLTDIFEMLADWMASSERTKNGDIFKSIEINAERFNISDQLKSILINTVYEMKGTE